MEELTEKQRKVLEHIELRLGEGDGPSQRELAEHFGIAQNAVYQIVTYLKKKGYLQKSSRHRGLRLSETYAQEKQWRRGLAVIGRVAAGEPILAQENISEYIEIGDAIKNRSRDAFMLKVAGDSMAEAGILDGDYVIVRPQSQVESGEIGVVIIDEEATVKRVIFEGRRMVLRPANRRYKERVLDRDDQGVRIAGKVIGCFRSM